MKMQIPHVLAAVEKREQHKVAADNKDLFVIGDALLTDVGRDASLKAASKELLARGFKEYSVSYLNRLRNAALTFPRARRHDDVSFRAHEDAASPDFLDWVVEEHGTEVGGNVIRKLRKQWQALNRQRKRKQYEAAKEEERRASTPQEKQKARERVEKLRSMPEPSVHETPRPDNAATADLRNMAANLDFDLSAKDMLARLRAQLKAIDKTGVDPEFAEALDDTYRDIATVVEQIRSRLSEGKRKFKSIAGGKA